MADSSKESLLRRRDVQARVGLKRSALYDAISRGDFPAPVKIGARSVAWPESAVNAWIAARISDARRSSPEGVL